MTDSTEPRPENIPTDMLKSPKVARRFYDKLSAFKEQTEFDLQEVNTELESLRAYLEISEKVSGALETLSQTLFNELLNTIETQMTMVLQEVLEQPIQLKSTVAWKNKQASVDFHIERNGGHEDILKGQGGSVTNIVSVGLRMFALATLSEKDHRPFLVLDEQDCWLRPDLVPRLVKIVYQAGKELNFQVLMISHHNRAAFEQYADRIYQLQPGVNGTVNVDLLKGSVGRDVSHDQHQ